MSLQFNKGDKFPAKRVGTNSPSHGAVASRQKASGQAVHHTGP